MNQIAELRTQVVTRGRRLKFTPERIQQIKNLVERGKSRGEIAELVGVTVGSLQVTCSRLGISLRQPRFKTGTGPLRNEPRSNGVSRPSPGRGDGSALLQLIKERPEQNSRSAPVDQAQAPTPRQECAKTANGAGAASFAIKMQYRGDVRTTELPLAQDMIGQLAFEAAFRNVTIGELIGELIVAVVNKDLLQEALEHNKP
jgi:Helix-turn-helix domain of resolvase